MFTVQYCNNYVFVLQQLEGAQQIVCPFPSLNESSSQETQQKSLALSSTSVYRVKLNNSIVPECKPIQCLTPPCPIRRCTTNYKFQWFQDEDCSAVFVCPEIQGNSCGDFGISIDFPEEEPRQVSIQYFDIVFLSHLPHFKIQVCYEGELHSTNVSFYSISEVSVWYLQQSEFSINCLFWCSNQGTIPLKPNVTDADEELVEDLVSIFFDLQSVLQCISSHSFFCNR